MDILVNVSNQRLKVSTNFKRLITGSQEFVRFVFNLTSDWDGLLTFAQFQQNGNAYNKYLDADNCAYLPSEIEAGTFRLTLCGDDGTTVATTNYVELNIDESVLVSDGMSTEISQSLYDQMVAKFNEVLTRSEQGIIITSDMSENDPSSPGYVMNRTHWKEEVKSNLDIQWDGVVGDKPYVSYDEDYNLVKVSDILPTEEDLNKCVMTLVDPLESEGQYITTPADIGGITVMSGCLTIGEWAVTVVYDREAFAGTNLGFNFPENGLYFLGYTNADAYVYQLYSEDVKISEIVYHALEEGYLPESAFANANFAETDENSPGFIKGLNRKVIPDSETIAVEDVSGIVDLGCILEVGETYRIIFGGIEYEKVCSTFILGDNTHYFCGNLAILNQIIMTDYEDTEEPFLVYGSDTLTQVAIEDTSAQFSISLTRLGKTITTIPVEYFPETGILPDVTADDVGKVLAVSSDGKWVAAESPSIVTLTQSEYDALDEVQDSVLYVIVG